MQRLGNQRLELDFAAERQRLMEVLHSKKDQELQGLSVEEIERRLSQLE